MTRRAAASAPCAARLPPARAAVCHALPLRRPLASCACCGVPCPPPAPLLASRACCDAPCLSQTPRMPDVPPLHFPMAFHRFPSPRFDFVSPLCSRAGATPPAPATRLFTPRAAPVSRGRLCCCLRHSGSATDLWPRPSLSLACVHTRKCNIYVTCGCVYQKAHPTAAGCRQSDEWASAARRPAADAARALPGPCGSRRRRAALPPTQRSPWPSNFPHAAPRLSSIATGGSQAMPPL